MYIIFFFFFYLVVNQLQPAKNCRKKADSLSCVLNLHHFIRIWWSCHWKWFGTLKEGGGENKICFFVHCVNKRGADWSSNCRSAGPSLNMRCNKLTLIFDLVAKKIMTGWKLKKQKQTKKKQRINFWSLNFQTYRCCNNILSCFITTKAFSIDLQASLPFRKLIMQ